MNWVVMLIVILYFIISLGLGIWVARKEENRIDDYFLAGRKLPWYAVSMSMTGSNIGTEHFIGMIGTAYVFGLAPATFEWGNFIPYSVLLWIFLPYFYRKKLYTIPEFLERRYNRGTRSIFAALTLSHMVLAVLVPALFAGGLIIYEMIWQQPVETFSWSYMTCIALISAVTAAYCIYGGLLSVVWTDVLQVIILVIGGILITVIGIGYAGGWDQVISSNQAADPNRFSLILPSDHPVSPWTGVATFWLTLSMWYVGTNQFYIQRCLGAKTEWDAKMGVIGCAFMKIFLPFIIVFPGLIAFTSYGPGLAEDHVYMQLINDLMNPLGQGILLAALIAAIMSTVSSVLNSTSTIWAIDIHRQFINKNATEEQQVTVGRWTAFIVILLSTLLAPMLIGREGGIFIYIQEMAAFFAPSISVIFLAAFFSPKTHSRSATITLLSGIVFGLILLYFAKDVTWLAPLLNRAAVAWILCFLVLVFTTILIPPPQNERYDRDAIWTPKWGRLPAQEQPRNRSYRNLMLWWLLLIVASSSLFIYFR